MTATEIKLGLNITGRCRQERISTLNTKHDEEIPKRSERPSTRSGSTGPRFRHQAIATQLTSMTITGVTVKET